MRTIIHRLGAGVLLAGAAMLGGCLNPDKPAVRQQVTTPKPVVNNGQQPVNSVNNGQQPFGPQGGLNGQPTIRTSGTGGSGQFNDPNRVAVNGGPMGNGGVAGVNNPPLNNGIQQTNGFGANPNANPNFNPNQRPIGSSLAPNNPNGMQPIIMNNGAGGQPNTNGLGGQPGNLGGMPPIDPTPSQRNMPPPVSMQNADRDLGFPRSASP